MNRPFWLILAAFALLWGVGETAYRAGYNRGLYAATYKTMTLTSERVSML